MAVVSIANGSQLAVISTEHTLTTQTAAGIYALGVDLNVLANGDTVELTVKTKMKSGSTSRVAYKAVYVNAQSDPNKYSIPIPSDTEVVFTLKQTAGTGRTFDWNVLKF